MHKYLLTALTAAVMEFLNTCYVQAVGDRNPWLVTAINGLQPFSLFLFADWFLEAKSRLDRLKLTGAVAVGYMLGGLVALWLWK